MALKVANRGDVPMFLALETLREATALEADGKDVLHLEIGQPFDGAPAAVLEKLAEQVCEKPIAYTEALGIRPLRERVAGLYAERYGVDVPVERIAITVGSSTAFILSFLAAFEAGDRVALATPCYPAYRNILLALGLVPVELPCTAETQFQPTPEMLTKAHAENPVAGLILASPANPTGGMLKPHEFEALINWCDQNHVRLVSDEIYHGITFGGVASSALETTKNAVVINSFSKYFALSGWRLGWMIMPEDLAPAIEKLAQSFYISAPAMSQYAATEVFEHFDELDGRVAAYSANRRLLLERLPKLGLDQFVVPEGAFYFYLDVSRFTNDSQAFCSAMLNEIGVAMTPGVDFDPDRGNRYVRLSFAGPESDMIAACDRLEGWLKR
ncbi:MAG: aminotransferase class I/II-fold pyridoxal phosphate-dependent enzyme [Alphaproteobacteria bacterium]|nr:aminotransferase class I/II-fold pyridoxal phosphate-dependent enzyme [Alphaproteobacteria bacterium SS10]